MLALKCEIRKKDKQLSAMKIMIMKKIPIEKAKLKKNEDALIKVRLINTFQKGQIIDLKEKNFVIKFGFFAMSSLTLLSLTTLALFRRIEIKKI